MESVIKSSENPDQVVLREFETIGTKLRYLVNEGLDKSIKRVNQDFFL